VRVLFVAKMPFQLNSIAHLLKVHFSWRRSSIRRMEDEIEIDGLDFKWASYMSPRNKRWIRTLEGLERTQPKTESAGRSDSVRPPLTDEISALYPLNSSTQQVSCVFFVFFLNSSLSRKWKSTQVANFCCRALNFDPLNLFFKWIDINHGRLSCSSGPH
jgi:hypothetical protein